MKVKILRNVGLDLIHNLGLKGITIPKDLCDGVEGQEKDLKKDAAEKLIELNLAEKLDEPEPHRGPTK